MILIKQQFVHIYYNLIYIIIFLNNENLNKHKVITSLQNYSLLLDLVKTLLTSYNDF